MGHLLALFRYRTLIICSLAGTSVTGKTVTVLHAMHPPTTVSPVAHLPVEVAWLQADEHLAGFMPSHGTELCGVVEAMFSYEVCGDILGDPFFYERAERIAYNALPATLVRRHVAVHHDCTRSHMPLWRCRGCLALRCVSESLTPPSLATHACLA